MAAGAAGAASLDAPASEAFGADGRVTFLAEPGAGLLVTFDDEDEADFGRNGSFRASALAGRLKDPPPGRLCFVGDCSFPPVR